MNTWQRNLYVLTAAELVAIAGFSVIMPFLPYYIQELGVTDPDQVKLWSGWLVSSQAVAMAAIAPVWGALADRHGRKMMVERAMFGGAVVFVAMGFAGSVQQLLVLRMIQGLLTGTVPAATALVASTTPRERSGYSLGLLQTGIYLGASSGPLIGGLVADSLGYRAAFWVTSLLLFLAGLAVHFLVHEGALAADEMVARNDGHLWDGLLMVLRSSALRVVALAQLVARLGNRVVGPMLPLFIQELATTTTRLATVAGLISGAGSAASALGSFYLGRKSDEIGHRKMLLVCALGMVVFYLPQAAVTDPLQLGALQVVVGFLMAGEIASLSALLARWVPEGRQGAVYGFNTTVVAAANALAPTMGASVAVWWGLRPIFLVAAGLFLVTGLIAAWLVPAPGREGLSEPLNQV